MQFVPLGNLVDFIGGGTPSKKEPLYWGGGIPWASVKDLTSKTLNTTTDTISELGLENSTSKLIPQGSLIIATRMALGRAVITDIDVAINQDLKAIKITSSLDVRFLYHWFLANEKKIDLLGTGATVKGVTVAALKQLEIPLLSLKEQKRIAAILDKADTIRRKRQRAIELADEFLRSVFLDMFGDPVTNPKGWDEFTIGELADQVQYGSSAKANTDGVGVPILRMGNVTYDGKIDLTDLKHLQIAKDDEKKMLLSHRDVLFNRTNSRELVGKTSVWEEDVAATFAGYLIRVKFNLEKVLPEYVASAFNTANYKRYLFATAKPSVNMSNISGSTLKSLRLPVPDLSKQSEFVKIRTAVLGSQKKAQRALATSSELFSSLQQQAFKGEL